MTLSETFCNPLEPSQSIQLNNRYWPGDRFTLLGALRDAEGALASDGVARAVRQLLPLRKLFGSDGMYRKFVARLHRLHSSQSKFGCVTGRLDLPEEVVRANQYSGTEARAVYPLKMREAFAPLRAQARRHYCQEYGYDMLRLNCSVRFAMPDERVADMRDFGVLSDYHNDEYKGLTSIVYLSEVRDEEGGAFSYIAGSHVVPRSIVLSAIHQCVDIDMRLSTPEALRPLPLEFRGSCGIGNFLDPEKVEAFLSQRVVVAGPVGTFAMFNGQYVLHRGGKPAAGSRTAAFIQPEGMVRLKMKGLQSRLFGALRP